MRLRESLVGLMSRAIRRPALTLALLVAPAAAGAALATGLRPSTAMSTFVSSSSPSYRATQRDYRSFGGEAVIVLVREPLTDLLLSSDLGRLSELEACLSGQVLSADRSLRAFIPHAPSAQQPPYGGWDGVCAQLARTRAVRVVYGPGTFLNEAVIAVDRGLEQLLGAIGRRGRAAAGEAYALARARGEPPRKAEQAARAAARLALQQEEDQLAQFALETGVSSPPAIDNAAFISEIAFDQARGVNQPKTKFAYLFPTARSALIQVRLRDGISTARQARAIALIRRAVRMPIFALRYGGTYTVTGEPVVVSDLTGQITHSLLVLLLTAVGVMALALAVVFPRRLRLLPLGVALGAVAITFGVVALIGAKLTMASIAALPILIGLSVDYAIQFQARALEGRPGGAVGAAGAALGAVRAARAGAPAILTAALATGAGFLVLLLSPVPMVGSFGLLLVLGIAIAVPCALLGGAAALVLAERDGGALGAAVRGAGEILAEAREPARRRLAAALGKLAHGHGRARREAGLAAMLAPLVRHPGRVLAVGTVLAALGWAADAQIPVQSNITRLVPSAMPALRNLRTLERTTGSSGEIDVIVRARDVATAGVLSWMSSYERRLLAHFGYNARAGCRHATLCPSLSLPDLFSSTQPGPGANRAGSPTSAQIKALLGSLPPYFKQAVIARDGRVAELSFGIRLMALARQQRVLDYMRSQLHPPVGVSAQLAGLPVLAAEANAALASPMRRLEMVLAGLAAVGLALALVRRRIRQALVPLLPIALAGGWSGLILYLIGIPLNPMSATLSALVIAIATEFSVLLSERFAQERAASGEPFHALLCAYRSTGAAVLASGATAIAGFGVLMFSAIRMLSDFGLVTVIDLGASLLGVLVVLPATLALAEQAALRPPAPRGRRWPRPAWRRPGRGRLARRRRRGPVLSA